MFTSDSHGALALAHERGRHLRTEAEADRLRGTSQRRPALAASLRRAADRLESASLAGRPAAQS
jgi:hypothetical protein